MARMTPYSKVRSRTPMAMVLPRMSAMISKTTTLATALGIGLVVFVFASVLMLGAGIKRTLSSTGKPDVAIIKAIDIVSIIILLILVMILANTIAMGVRERTFEYGVMRAIGFLPRHIVLAIMAEAVFIGLIAGLVGLALGYLFVDRLLGQGLEQNMAGIFPYFRLQASAAIAAVAASVALGTLAGLVPAWRASRLAVTDALRRVG